MSDGVANIESEDKTTVSPFRVKKKKQVEDISSENRFKLRSGREVSSGIG